MSNICLLLHHLVALNIFPHFGDYKLLLLLLTLNSISSKICQQNAHFNMYTTTSKHQEGSTCKDSHLKCFKTTNSTAKLWRGVINSDKVLRACFHHFPPFSAVFLLKFLNIVHIHILQKYLYKTQILRCR